MTSRRRHRPHPPGNAISGVFNYCDKWCQRCEFTQRCSVYAMELEEKREAPAGGAGNREFWGQVGAAMGDALEMLREHSLEMGIDPDEPPSAEELAEEERIDREVRENRLTRAAEDYRQSVHDWLAASEPLLKAKEDEINQQARLALPGAADPRGDAAELLDLLDVIQWYFTVIPAKVHRAVSSAVRGVPELIADEPKDSDGSAKAALISVERSMGAWMRLRAHFPEQKDAILDKLLALDRLRRGLERDFPRARAFVRPGFDEPAEPCRP
jgi:hypothetical protein